MRCFWLEPVIASKKRSGNACAPLFVAAAEERIIVDKKRTSPLFDKRSKSSVKVAFAAGVQDTNLLPVLMRLGGL